MPDRAMRIDAFDPVDSAEDAIALPIGPDNYILAYYRPFLTAIDVGQAVEESGPIISGNFGAFGLTVGVLRTVYERVRLAEDGVMEGLYQDVQALVDDAFGWEPGLFADGTAVETNWDQSIGTQDWEA